MPAVWFQSQLPAWPGPPHSTAGPAGVAGFDFGVGDKVMYSGVGAGLGWFFMGMSGAVIGGALGFLISDQLSNNKVTVPVEKKTSGRWF